MRDSHERWPRAVEDLKERSSARDREVREYLDADEDAVGRALRGTGPDDKKSVADLAAHMVVNVAAAHVPAFCEASAPAANDSCPYKNCYDLGKHVVGDQSKRVLVDSSLPAQPYQDIYFGAIELNGCGIRFYGDFCLLLRSGLIDDATVLLDRNSYDLERPPLSNEIYADPDPSTKREELAREHSGTWEHDLCHMAFLKIIDRYGARRRRFTTGEISDGVLVDEDYVEVLWIRRDGNPSRKSFGAEELIEARVSAADVALEERIASGGRVGPPPPIEQLLWRNRRRSAERALRGAGVDVRVITTTGRVRS